MKKFILGITTLICYSTMAQEFEANIKVGYDFYRSSTFKNEQNKKGFKTNEYERGFVIGLELLPLKFKNDKIKLGVGVEYNFGETTLKYKKDSMFSATMIPLYATAKFTYYRPKNIDLNLYTFARLGWAFARERPTRAHYPLFPTFGETNGLYYGLGLGLDYKYFLAEILYDGKYDNKLQYMNIELEEAASIIIHKPKDYYMKHYFHHKVGVRLGLQLGTQHFKKPQILDCSKCEPKVIEKVVEVPKVLEKKIIIKKFDISAQALFAFDKYSLSDIKENGKKIIFDKIKELKASGFEITGINVIGHTDRLGTDDYNYRLGLNRANTIREYLKELGIKVEISSSSKGKTEPKVYCDNISSSDKLRECLQPNRRVEIQFMGLETQQKIEKVEKR